MPDQGDGSLHSPRGERRERAKGWEQLAVAVSPSVLVVTILLVATGSPRLAPEGLWGDPWSILMWIAVGALAGLHRPPLVVGESSGPTLGFGAFVLPAVLATEGTVPTALVAGAALLGSEALRQVTAARLRGGDNALGRLVPALERAVLVSFTVLAVGTFLFTEAVGALPSWVALGLSTLLFVGTFGITVMVLGLWRRKFAKPTEMLEIFRPMILDGLGWMVGWWLSRRLVVEGADGPVVDGAWIWWIVAAALVEAARHAALRGLSDHRVGDFERLREAHERILLETSGMGDIARQVLVECRNILPVQWFLFELPDDESDVVQSWAAGPDGLLVEGRPRPPSRPNMLPGIHRRAEWKVIERTLVRVTPDDGEQLLSRLRLWCDPRRVEPGAEELLDTLVPQMASSVHRAMLDQEAKLDPLTGVPVRRVLESRMQRAYRRSIDEGVPMSVIMCDIDFFKKVNDTYGHAAGDEALKLVAATLDGGRRETDLCCRYGGEEFTVLLDRTHGDDALLLAERLRRAVEDLRFVFEGRPVPLTLSLGVAAFPELHIKTASELLLLADEALYEAKKRGRNQCLLNIGRNAFRPPPGSRRQESSTMIPRPL